MVGGRFYKLKHVHRFAIDFRSPNVSIVYIFINLVLLKLAEPYLIKVGMLFKMIELLFLDNRVHPSTLWIKQLIFQITTHIIITLCVAVSFAFFAHCAPQQELMLWHGQRTQSAISFISCDLYGKAHSSFHHIISFHFNWSSLKQRNWLFDSSWISSPSCPQINSRGTAESAYLPNKIRGVINKSRLQEIWNSIHSHEIIFKQTLIKRNNHHIYY